MSQEKVDRYKLEKANRKKIMKKQKRRALLTKIMLILFALLFIGFIAWSIYISVNPSESGSDSTATLSSEEYQSVLESLAAAATTSSDATTVSSETTASTDETTAADTTEQSASE